MNEGPAERLTEAEAALFALVEALEANDYRCSSGMLATQTAAFLGAKALLSLWRVIGRRRSG